jgi:hypothetical protein
LTGLDLAGLELELSAVFAHVPNDVRADPRFAKHEGRVEQAVGRWREAAAAYQRAWKTEPDITVGHRLRRALALAGQTEDAEQFDRVILEYRAAYKETRSLLSVIDAAVVAGRTPAPEVLSRMAALRAQLKRPDEASAWARLAIPHS